MHNVRDVQSTLSQVRSPENAKVSLHRNSLNYNIRIVGYIGLVTVCA